MDHTTASTHDSLNSEMMRSSRVVVDTATSRGGMEDVKLAGSRAASVNRYRSRLSRRDQDACGVVKSEVMRTVDELLQILDLIDADC